MTVWAGLVVGLVAGLDLGVILRVDEKDKNRQNRKIPKKTKMRKTPIERLVQIKANL